MALDKNHAKQLKKALVDAFPTKGKLAQVVKYGLNKNLDQVAFGENLDEVVFKVIQQADANNQIGRLVETAREENPGNILLKTFAENFEYLLYDAQPEPDNLSDPYQGLNAFTENDAKFFFGRDRHIDQLVEEVNQQKLVVVLGASGSGKSSLVFAGLIPRLMAQQNWIIAKFQPRREPLKPFMAALLLIQWIQFLMMIM
ncbi:MAG: effector-associated domain EAD1-containing protein [Chloroflexota bacterium]